MAAVDVDSSAAMDPESNAKGQMEDQAGDGMDQSLENNQVKEQTKSISDVEDQSQNSGVATEDQSQNSAVSPEDQGQNSAVAPEDSAPGIEAESSKCDKEPCDVEMCSDEVHGPSKDNVLEEDSGKANASENVVDSESMSEVKSVEVKSDSKEVKSDSATKHETVKSRGEKQMDLPEFVGSKKKGKRQKGGKKTRWLKMDIEDQKEPTAAAAAAAAAPKPVVSAPPRNSWMSNNKNTGSSNQSGPTKTQEQWPSIESASKTAPLTDSTDGAPQSNMFDSPSGRHSRDESSGQSHRESSGSRERNEKRHRSNNGDYQQRRNQGHGGDSYGNDSYRNRNDAHRGGNHTYGHDTNYDSSHKDRYEGGNVDNYRRGQNDRRDDYRSENRRGGYNERRGHGRGNRGGFGSPNARGAGNDGGNQQGGPGEFSSPSPRGAGYDGDNRQGGYRENRGRGGPRHQRGSPYQYDNYQGQRHEQYDRRRSDGHSSQGSDKDSPPKDPMFRLSKTLSYLLRHGAEREGFTLQEGGFLYVDELLELRQLNMFSLDDVRSIVASNDKKRFHLETDVDSRLKIRANQGHTLAVEGLELTPITDPASCPTVIHGTYYKFWSSIKKQGLKRFSRTHIHFAPGIPGQDEVISGMRRSCELIVYLDLAAAMRDGIEFFISANNVILSAGNPDGAIPSKYFKQAIDRQTGKPV